MIPKRKVPVVVRLVSGEALSGDVFLDYIDVIHRGEQTILDKLNDDYVWFPVNGGGDRVEIVNRRHVAFVQPASGVPAELVRPDPSDGEDSHFRTESVTLRLRGGGELEGRVPMDLPEEFSRISDFLNFPQDFFVVETADGPVVVSKEHVVSLVPHEKPPAMPDRPGNGGP